MIGEFEEYGNIFNTDSRYSVKPRHDLLKLLPMEYSCKSILELGCADGENIRFFSEKLKVSLNCCCGVDICKSSKNSYFKFHFEHSSIENFFKKSKEKYDLILLSDVLEHLYNPWKILLEAKRSLSEHGMILVSVPNLQNLNYINSINTGNFFYQNTGLFDQTHIRFFSASVLKQYLEDCGFKIISSGWRPDQSLCGLKEGLIRELQKSAVTKIRIRNIEIEICQDNIEEYFGQQILIGASHG